jgi:uncharacterized protein (TIGR03792 family)
MEIERLSFQITPEDRVEDFIDADKKVWNPWLQQQKGFLRKTYQRYPGGRLNILIFWARKEDWDRASKDSSIPAIDVMLQSQFLGVYQRIT